MAARNQAPAAATVTSMVSKQLPIIATAVMAPNQLPAIATATMGEGQPPAATTASITEPTIVAVSTAPGQRPGQDPLQQVPVTAAAQIATVADLQALIVEPIASLRQELQQTRRAITQRPQYEQFDHGGLQKYEDLQYDEPLQQRADYNDQAPYAEYDEMHYQWQQQPYAPESFSTLQQQNLAYRTPQV